MNGPYVKYWDLAREGRHREGKQVRKTSVSWQCPRAQEAVQGKRNNLSGKEETRRVEALQPPREGPHRQPPAVRMGGGSQARVTRTAPWEEEAFPDWGLGLEVPSSQPGCHGHRDKERS